MSLCSSLLDGGIPVAARGGFTALRTPPNQLITIRDRHLGWGQ